MDKHTKRMIETAKNRANLSYLGLLIPIVGIGFGISAFSLTSLIPDNKKTEDIIAAIKYKAMWGIVLSVAVTIIAGVVWNNHVQKQQDKAMQDARDLQQQLMEDARTYRY